MTNEKVVNFNKEKEKKEKIKDALDEKLDSLKEELKELRTEIDKIEHVYGVFHIYNYLLALDLLKEDTTDDKNPIKKLVKLHEDNLSEAVFKNGNITLEQKKEAIENIKENFRRATIRLGIKYNVMENIYHAFIVDTIDLSHLYPMIVNGPITITIPAILLVRKYEKLTGKELVLGDTADEIATNIYRLLNGKEDLYDDKKDYYEVISYYFDLLKLLTEYEKIKVESFIKKMKTKSMLMPKPDNFDQNPSGPSLVH